MKIVAAAIVSLILSTFFLVTAEASIKKSNYTSPKNLLAKVSPKKNMTNVKSHARTTRNSTKADNWSTIGNINPYTGKRGTRRL